MKAIILAAGKGSRLGELTKNRPKCLVELSGQPLLFWQLHALRSAGITDITVVTGYGRELIEAQAETQGFATRHNANWSETNMVSTLFCVRDLIDCPCIVSYSDIVYNTNLVRTLMESDAPLGVAFDRAWIDLWRARFDDPLEDAESFQISNAGYILDIGRKVLEANEIEGQYIGLIRVTPTSIKRMYELTEKRPELGAAIDMTNLLRQLIATGYLVTGIETFGKWCEIDTQSDLAIAKSLLAEGKLDNPFVHNEA